MNEPSFFLVLEGIDGAGKTSIARRLFTTMQQTSGDNVLLTEEPHNASLMGGEIRRALRRKLELSPIEIALAFALNRSHHLRTVIEPHLNADKRSVICDRYLLSSLVYQSRGDLDMNFIYRLNRQARPPDLTIVLQVSAVEAYRRMDRRKASPELFENDLPSRLQKYQDGIALLREKGHIIVDVDGNGQLADVFAAVVAAIKQHKPPWLRIQPPLLPLD